MGWIAPYKDLSGYDPSNRVYFRTSHLGNQDFFMQVGLIVQFTLYCDAKGLGAMNVQLATELQQEQYSNMRPSKLRKKFHAQSWEERELEEVKKDGIKIQILQKH